MTNKVYDILKYIAQVALPALATFVVGFTMLWNLPYGEAIAGTIMLIDALLGELLRISTKRYNARLNKEVEIDDVE